jgi:hypothetical protein
MSILGSIVSAIFGHASATPASGASHGQATPAPAAPSTAPTPTPGQAQAQAQGMPPKPAAPVDVEAVLTNLAAHNREKLDWRVSIVDLMKLLNLDSSLAARKALADELHYTGDKNDSATMNIWLHKQVMQKLADNGGKVPADLH